MNISFPSQMILLNVHLFYIRTERLLPCNCMYKVGIPKILIHAMRQILYNSQHFYCLSFIHHDCDRHMYTMSKVSACLRILYLFYTWKKKFHRQLTYDIWIQGQLNNIINVFWIYLAFFMPTCYFISIPSSHFINFMVDCVYHKCMKYTCLRDWKLTQEKIKLYLRKCNNIQTLNIKYIRHIHTCDSNEPNVIPKFDPFVWSEIYFNVVR